MRCILDIRDSWLKTQLRCLLLLLLLLLGSGGLISKVHQAPEVDATVVGETDLTCPGCGVAICAAVGLKMLQSCTGQLRIPHAPVSCHACIEKHAEYDMSTLCAKTARR